jgi:hypothetical protein
MGLFRSKNGRRHIKLAQWREHLPRAEAPAVDALVDAALGNEPPDNGSTLAETKSAIAVLSEQVAMNKKTRRALAEKLEVAQRDLRIANSAIKDCVVAVLWSAPETLRLLSDLKLATATRISLPRELDHFAVTNPNPDRTPANNWAAAKKALETDAGAPLPTS